MIKYATRLPPGKGVKILNDTTIRKNGLCSEIKTLNCITALANHFISKPDPLVVPIYNFEIIDAVKNPYKYRYDMRRLGILNSIERDIVDIAGNLADRYDSDALHHMQDSDDYKKYGYEYAELFSFLKEVLKLNRYYDLHSGNVMIDLEDNYRLVDIEGFIRTPLELRCNDWIIR
ncbi:hypothetical protein UFOVP1290_249 [uncultured Caudovirales phage]|uniref:Uncharacterized protein n=1 Tax=uncultured Caudovirales phage TaxID=2100421 RepID=A0A6J5RI80_9CAUD|nr:hypothetical protein UFOVP1290_249 [uncultured Caudovirales phage]